jgi:EmrB/QacA subfamily drug resistance transporter
MADESVQNSAPKMSERTQDKPALSVPHPWWALTATLIGLSMIIIDGSIVNVLLPDMVKDIGLTQTDTQWVNSIYSLVFAALLITVGLMADRHGRRLLFVMGTVVFLVGSALSGSAQDPSFLIGARAVQAVGASMMLPSSIAVINVMFSGKQRAMAFGFWGAVFGGAAALGPLLGGWLAQDFTWRYAFYVNIPIGIIATMMVIKYVPETKSGETGEGFDIGGVILSASGLALIVYGLIEGQQYGWWSAIADFDLGPIQFNEGGVSIAPVTIFVGIFLLVLLVFWEEHRARVGRSLLIDLSLFKIPRYAFGNIVALIVALGEFGILFVLPLWMVAVHGLDLITVGIILASLAIGTLGAGGAARHVSAVLGSTNVVRLGMVLEVIGILAIGALLSVTLSPWWLIIPLIVYGIGLGFDSAQLTNVVLSDVPSLKSGQASAMTSTFRQVGSALGAAVIGAVLFTGLGNILSDELAQEKGITTEQQAQIVDSVQSSAGQSIPSLAEVPGLERAVTDAKESYTEAAKLTAFVAAMFVFLGLLFSFGLPSDRKPQDAQADGEAGDGGRSEGAEPSDPSSADSQPSG